MKADFERDGTVFVESLQAAYGKAVEESGIAADDLAHIVVCWAYATVQLTFDLSKEELVRAIGSSVARYIKGGMFDLNREGADRSETLQ